MKQISEILLNKPRITENVEDKKEKERQLSLFLHQPTVNFSYSS